MKKFIDQIVFIAFIISLLIIANSDLTEAKPVETTPHIFVDVVNQDDWHLNGDKNIIFAGYGSPLFKNKKTHYIVRKTIQYGKMTDGRLVIKCNFNNMYEFACFYPDKKADGSHRARFMMGNTINGNVSALEVDSVLADFNATDIEPFPPLGTNVIPARIVEMLYFIVKGDKYYGDLNPEDFINDETDIINPYTQDLYDRCIQK